MRSLPPRPGTSVSSRRFTVLAFVSFFRKSVALKYVTLAASVGYLGFDKSQLISIVNVFGLVDCNLPIFKYKPRLVSARRRSRSSPRCSGDASTAAASARSARSRSCWTPSLPAALR